MDTNKMREQFEAAFVERQVGAFGEDYRSTAQHMLKREGDFDEPPTAYKLHCRNRGMYDTYWVEMAWWAWQASREAVVVELPQPFVGDDFTMYDGKEIIEAIEAQGLKVEVKP
ncbi:hypothetical protein NNX13_21995 [Pseudomonas sp. Eb3]|uniref:hypothetical protein n=1 Tax=Pseudomonas sp. Eb3 TaxID=1327558 RepID=UPI0021058C91|nr:hypothetical protein [Pseudomonas sp. Eb3]MCQ1992498.1 hypothetical protein [Pseudomonas sp. Eb3]